MRTFELEWDKIVEKYEQGHSESLAIRNVAMLALYNLHRIGQQELFGNLNLTQYALKSIPSCYLMSEVGLEVGLVNVAQRTAFEAMEAIPNYNKSGRVLKRLAETNLINGQYEVARKYLRILQKTIFYRPWAQRTLKMLGDEKAINAHPLYGTLRQYRLKDDFLFSEKEMDKICGQLFMHNHQNQMAAQYLLMGPLLDKDIPRFMQYAQYVQGQIHYNPRNCQEAIAFAFMQQRQQPPQGVVSPFVLEQMNDFTRIYSGDKNAPELVRFKNTAWYYLMIGN